MPGGGEVPGVFDCGPLRQRGQFLRRRWRSTQQGRHSKHDSLAARSPLGASVILSQEMQVLHAPPPENGSGTSDRRLQFVGSLDVRNRTTVECEAV